MLAPRSILFVPADRMDRVEKALSSNADAICIDLEDAVAPGAKEAARASLINFISAREVSDRVIIRLNGADTAAGALDIAAFSAAPKTIWAFMIPKADDPQKLTQIYSTLEIPLIALIESAQGLRRGHEIARVLGIIGLALGSVDLAAQLDAALSEANLTLLRLQLRLAAAEGRGLCWDGPFLALKDQDGLSAAAVAAATLGYAGKLCIHPAQIDAVNAAFTPTVADLASAARIVDVAALSDAGAFQLDGRMVDEPIVIAARKTLARAALRKKDVK